MAKLTLNGIVSGYASNAAINTNNTLIETALENTLSRDGTTPNTMSANLDMNSNKITNLSAPTTANDAARLTDVQAAISGNTTANLILFAPAGNIAATTVQGAILELYVEKAALTGAAFTGPVSGTTGTFSGPVSIAPATAATHAPTAAQIQSQSLTAFTTAGTSTAYTLTPAPAIAAYAAGQSFFVTFNLASGAAPTLAISGIATPPNLVRQDATGAFVNIAANDIPLNHRSRVTLLSATQALVEDVPPIGQVFHIRDEKASGTAGGASVAGDQTRTLNTVVKNTIVGASLAANDFTLPPGTYSIEASAPAYLSQRHRLRLFNITAAAVGLRGKSSLSDNAGMVTDSVMTGEITIAATSSFRLVHRITNAAATSGLGVETNDTFIEVYTDCVIRKLS